MRIVELLDENPQSYEKIFASRWLFEMPLYTGPSVHNPYHVLDIAIESNIDSYGIKPVQLSPTLFSLPLADDDIYFWIEHNGEKDIIAHTKKFRKGLAVLLIGKREGSNIFASDFYVDILKYTKQPLLFSDDKLSDEALKLWKRLLSFGKNITVYDSNNPDSFIQLSTAADLDKYMGILQKYTDYRFVLSNGNAVLSEFKTYQMYKMVHNIPLEG
jgi:hypothetical protein